MDGNLPHDQAGAERQVLKYLKLMRIHHELASLYRAKSNDRRTISQLWYLIEGLELDLLSEGVVL